MITRILAKALKINVSDKTRSHLESLIMQAYEAGMRDRTADILATLEDDMIEGRHLDHMGTVDMIRSNWGKC